MTLQPIAGKTKIVTCDVPGDVLKLIKAKSEYFSESNSDSKQAKRK